MKKFFKWIGGSLLVLVGLAAATAFYLQNTLKNRLAKQYDIPPKAIDIPTDSVSLAAGKIWVTALCSDCHGGNLAGSIMINDPELGIISTPNITLGGAGKTYTDIDWDKAIRHGVAKDGRSLRIMSSKYFNHMTDEHLGQLIAYLKTVPDTTIELPESKTTLLCDILVQVGAFGDDVIPAEAIDHKSPSHTAPPKAPTTDYGNYLVKITGCRSCHGKELNGAKHPDPAVTIPASNLTPGGPLATYGQDGFIKTMRTGTTPMGKQMDPKHMPWKQLGSYDDVQLQAIYAYLMSLPKMEMAEIK